MTCRKNIEMLQSRNSEAGLDNFPVEIDDSMLGEAASVNYLP